MFVVICMCAVEATSSIVGAFGTLLLYGLLPLALFLWLVGTPQRRRNRRPDAGVRAGESFARRRTARDDAADEHDVDDRS